MKTVTFMILGSLLICGSRASAFSLDDIQSVVCKDRAPSADLDIYFTTESQAAHQYVRRSGELPYDYGNKQSPFMDFSTGVLKVTNNPDAESGTIVLGDNFDSNEPVELVLIPTQETSVYNGALTGAIETSEGWGYISNHSLICIVQ
jgi:hypothetical protein